MEFAARAEFHDLLCADTSKGIYFQAAELVSLACNGHLLRQRLNAIRSRATGCCTLWGPESEPSGED